MKRRVSRINAVNVTGTGRRSFCLRVCAAMAAVCVCAALLLAQSGGITTKDAKAKEAMDAAIKSIGGAGKIGDIKSLVIKGTWSRLPNVRASGLGMEIRILLPDSFVQIRQFELGNPSYRGVSQGTLIPPPNTTVKPKTPGDELSPERLEAVVKNITNINAYNTNKMIDEWSRFLIGMLMKADLAPLTISSGSTSGVFTLTKKDGALGEIEFDSKTGYPSVIRYKNPELPPGRILDFNTIFINPDGSLGTSGTSGGTQDPGGGEIRFQDRFSVEGIMFPRVITTTESDNESITELRIEEALINPKLSLKDFEVPQRQQE